MFIWGGNSIKTAFFSVFVVLLLSTILLSDNVQAQALDTTATTDLYTLLEVEGNYTSDNTLNISSDTLVSNSQAWTDFRTNFAIEGKLFGSDIPPNVYDVPRNDLVTMFRLPPAFFMQGVSSCWIRLPVEYESSGLAFRVTIEVMLSPNDPNGPSQVIMSDLYDTTENDRLKTRQYTYPAESGGSSYTYKYMYVLVNAPLYSDIDYKMTIEPPAWGSRINIYVGQTDNGLSGFRWSTIASQEKPVCLSLEFLGIYGLVDGSAGLNCPTGSYIKFRHYFKEELFSEYLTVFIQFQKAFYGRITITGELGWGTEVYDIPITNKNAWFLMSDDYKMDESYKPPTDYIDITIEFYSDNAVWLMDKNFPFNPGSHNPTYIDFSINSLYREIWFRIFHTIQKTNGAWTLTTPPIVIEEDYTYITAYLSYEERPSLNKDSIFYGVYKAGGKIDNVLSIVWGKAKDIGSTIFNALPENTKNSLTKMWEFGIEVGQVLLEWSNWVYEEISDLGPAVYNVGLKAYEWIKASIPSLQNILTKLLRTVLAVTIIALFVSIVYVMYKFLNVFRIWATGSFEESL